MSAPQRPTPRTDARENAAADATSYCLDGWAFARSLERSLSEREEECERLRADARRYRWLREKGDIDAVVDLLDEFHGITRLKTSGELDTAIDAALSAAEAGGDTSTRSKT